MTALDVVALVSVGLGSYLSARWYYRPRPRERVLLGAMAEGGAEAMLVTGCAIGLGWDGRGPMPRKLRREAVRRLEVAIARLGAEGHA